jgi:hypothetical protein
MVVVWHCEHNHSEILGDEKRNEGRKERGQTTEGRKERPGDCHTTTVDIYPTITSST